jgi:hypothetical protein
VVGTGGGTIRKGGQVHRYRASLVPAEAAPKASVPPRPSWRQTLADPTVAASILYSFAALLAIVCAYLALFSQFASYDDEGTLLVTVKAFAQGEVLYRDIFAIYGPFYYELFGGFFSLTGQEVTTEVSRTIVIFLWVGSSLLYGITAQRLTGRLSMGLAGMAGAFAALFVLETEPMHPQGLCALLLAGFTLLAVLGGGRRPGWAGAGAGALLAALVLTKLNLGAFAVAAVFLAAVLAVPALSRRRWLTWLVIAAVLVLGPFVLARDFSESWVRELMLVEILSMAAIVVVCWPSAADRHDDGDPTIPWLWGAAAGFVLAAVAIIVAILLAGSSPADLYDGVVTQALRVRDVLISPLNFPPEAINWAIATMTAAVLSRVLRPSATAAPSLWPGLLRALVGISILLVVAHIVFVGFNPSSGNPVLMPMLLAWVAAIPPAGAPEPTHKRFLRILLPALAVAETLQVYPVAGSQMGIASVSFVPVAALCLGDALVSLRAWGETRGTGVAGRLGLVTAVIAIGIAAQFTVNALVRPTVTNAIAYGEFEPLRVEGAGPMRLPQEEADLYSRLVHLLRAHRCSTFIGYPNVDSLYLWSGIEAPAPAAPGAWIKALDAEQQQRVVDEMKASPRPCAIRSDEQAESWLHGEQPPGTPLVRYVFDDFRPVAEAGHWEFMVPKGGS